MAASATGKWNVVGLAELTRPLSRALQKVWVFRFFDPGPGASGGPPEGPPGLSVGLPGAPGSLPEAPGT